MFQVEYEAYTRLLENYADVVLQKKHEISNAIDSIERNMDIQANERIIKRNSIVLSFINEVVTHGWQHAAEFHRLNSNYQRDGFCQIFRLCSKSSSEFSHAIRSYNQDGGSNEDIMLPHAIDQRTSICSIYTQKGISILHASRAKEDLRRNNFTWEFEKNIDLNLKENINHVQERVKLEDLILNFSLEQLAQFHLGPTTNCLVFGVAGSGKTQWALLRPLYLTMGLDKPLELEGHTVDKFRPLPIESVLGLTQSRELVGVLQKMVEDFPGAPIQKTNIMSWPDIQDAIISSKKYEITISRDYSTNALGLFDIHEIAIEFATKSLFEKFYASIKRKKLDPNLVYDKSKKYKIEDLKKDLDLHRDALSSDTRSNIDYSKSNFTDWVFMNILDVIKTFPGTSRSETSKRVSSKLRKQGIYLNDAIKNINEGLRQNEFTSPHFDFAVAYTLELDKRMGNKNIIPPSLLNKKHVFIDEYQDFSYVQNLIIDYMSAEDASKTLVGDPAQRVLEGDHVAIDNKFKKIEFTKNFRQTHYLGEFSSAFRKRFLDKKDIKTLDPKNSDQRVFLFSDDSIIDCVKEDLLSKDINSICIIFKEIGFASNILIKMRKHLNNKDIIDEKDLIVFQYGEKRVFIGTPKHVKGLEFDSAYVHSIYSYDMSKSYEARQLYVAFTRARLRMGVSYKGNDMLLIENQNLFDVIKQHVKLD